MGDIDTDLERFEDAQETLAAGEKMEESTETEDMDPNLWSSLREELIEKIIARLPLEALVRSQVLSKKWRSLFLSRPFQEEVSSVSSRWGSYFPLYVSEKGLIGYDPSSLKWQELFTLPEFPEDFCRGFSGPLAWTLSLSSVAGSLIILSHFSNHTLHIFVSNPINKSSRRLPPLHLTNDAPLDPRFDEWDDSVLVLPLSRDSYKVLVFSRNITMNRLEVRVYNSVLNSWTEPRPGPALSSDVRGLECGGYTGGVFYLTFLKSREELFGTLCSFLENLILFYSYDVRNGSFKEIVIPWQQVPDIPVRVCKLIVCGSELMLAVCQGSRDQDEEQRMESLRAQGMEVEDNDSDWGSFSQEYLYVPKDSFVVFRFDLKSMELHEISRGPPERLNSRTVTGLVVSDKESIYFQTESAIGDNEFGVVALNVRQLVWTYLPLDTLSSGFNIENINLTECPFQPGLNPFVVA